MKRIFFSILSFALVILLAGCSSGNPSQAASAGVSSAEYQKITAEEAKQKMDGGGVTVVDVRTEEEYAESHITNAVLLPNETLEQKAAETLPDQDAVLLVYCRSGRRSKEASEKLLKLGYQNVYDFGGIQDWPYDTTSD